MGQYIPEGYPVGILLKSDQQIPEGYPVGILLKSGQQIPEGYPAGILLVGLGGTLRRTRC